MEEISVDRQGRLVLPMAVRRRLGLDGRPGRVRLLETPEGVLLTPPPRPARVAAGDDGLPTIHIEGIEGLITNDEVLQAIDRERAGR